MPEIKALVIDDESLGREIIKNYLKNYPEITLAGECSNGFEGIKKVNELKPDILFLDIQMPKITGFEMLELIDDPPVIIFATAYDHFALKAFEVNAADYLLKPFNKDRFDEAIKKAVNRLGKRSDEKKLVNNIIEANDKREEILERIVIKDGSKINIVPVDTIKWIEAQDDYVMIHSTEGKYLKQKTMKYFEEHLSPLEFIRVHRSYIAAIKEIKKLELVEKESYQAILADKTTLPVSKTGYDKLKEILK